MSRNLSIHFEVCVVDDEVTDDAILKNLYDMLTACACNVYWGGSYEPLNPRECKYIMKECNTVITEDRRVAISYVKG